MEPDSYSDAGVCCSKQPNQLAVAALLGHSAQVSLYAEVCRTLLYQFHRTC